MRILVVDDEPLSRHVLQATVEQLGHEWTAAENGQAAWQCFNQDRPDVLITDLLMPEVDGLKLCRRVRGPPRPQLALWPPLCRGHVRPRPVQGLQRHPRPSGRRPSPTYGGHHHRPGAPGGGDSVYRYGGEEFLLILPEQTLETARIAVERVRNAVERLAFPQPAAGSGGTLTLSAGIAAFGPGGPTTVGELLEQADAALYRAKSAGRNQLAVADSPTR